MGLSDSVAEYDEYYDVALDGGGNEVTSDYNWLFQTPWLDFGDPVFTKILKQGLFTITGGEGAAATVEISKDYEEDSKFSKTFNLTSDAVKFLYGAANSLYGAAKYAPAASPENTGYLLPEQVKQLDLR